MQERVVQIKQIQQLLVDNKQVYVQTPTGYSKITKYINKGILKTFKVVLDNNMQIRVSKKHKFFQKSQGWIQCQALKQNKHLLLCNDKQYHLILKIEQIGYNKIVDITVENEDHCYYGNGILNHNSGKSLMCGHLIKSCQEMGGVPIFIDTEESTSKDFFKAIGVNLQQLVYIDMRGLQQIYNTIQTLVKSVRIQYPTVPVLICVDSITAASPQEQIAADHAQRGYDTLKARINSRSLKKLVGLIARQKIALVFTTQLRASMQSFGYGDKYTTSSGGYALQFYASWRLRLAKAGMLKAKLRGQDQVVGIKTIAKVQKSKLGPALGKCGFEIRYASGIDNYNTYFQFVKDYKLLSGKGTKDNPYIVKCGDQQIVVGNKFEQFLQQNSVERQKIYNAIADILIMEYKPAKQNRDLEVFLSTQDEDQDIQD